MCCKTTPNSNHTPRLTAITGGIGSGKSIVAQILTRMGYLVYDCDSRAKQLMDNDPTIAQAIAERISADAVRPDRLIDRKALSRIVFNDRQKLDILNSIVHHHVRDDIKRWAAINADEPRLWVETAILYESSLDKMVQSVWLVTAPLEQRISRVMQRNSCSRREVEVRIEAQSRQAYAPHPCIHTIVNDGGTTPLLPQIEHLLSTD